jgi:hypothetical protein
VNPTFDDFPIPGGQVLMPDSALDLAIEFGGDPDRDKFGLEIGGPGCSQTELQ